MTKEELIKEIEIVNNMTENKHIIHLKIDALLLEYINDERVSGAYHAHEKWYS